MICGHLHRSSLVIIVRVESVVGIWYRGIWHLVPCHHWRRLWCALCTVSTTSPSGRHWSKIPSARVESTRRGKLTVAPNHQCPMEKTNIQAHIYIRCTFVHVHVCECTHQPKAYTCLRMHLYVANPHALHFKAHSRSSSLWPYVSKLDNPLWHCDSLACNCTLCCSVLELAFSEELTCSL